MKLTHVIWTTYQNYHPNDTRGDWSELARLYEVHPDNYEFIDKSKMHFKYKKQLNSNAVFLSKEARSSVVSHIWELSNNDRVGSVVNVVSCGCSKIHVELLIDSDYFESKQALSRLKSRVATLLNFEYGTGGKQTWAKGIWASTVTPESELHALIKKRIKNVT